MSKTAWRGTLYAGAVYALGVLAARPRMERWGSTAEERALPLAGDELVPNAEQQTHAVTIDAPPEAVWRWLIQMGQGRAGFYSHDRLERLVGAAIRNADEIHPEWQRLAVGDLIRTYRSIPRFEPLGWIVAAIEPARVLVVHEPERRGIINSSWAFALECTGERTRLLSRWRFRPGVLHGLKTRAERQRSTRSRRERAGASFTDAAVDDERSREDAMGGVR